MHSCAVIGCGPAGMAASAVLRQYGLMVTCFEVEPEVGGIWAKNSRDVFSTRGVLSPVYPSMRCVLPKDLMSFSDVRFDYTTPQFPHHTAVRQYLGHYAERKGIRGLTRFNTKVESIRWDPRQSSWKLISVNIRNGDIMEWSFDRICVCTGQTQEARFPEGARELLHDYTRHGGEVHHAAHIKDFRAFANKRVAVVGDGVTAYDYCLELRRHGAQVYHSSTNAQCADAGALSSFWSSSAKNTPDAYRKKRMELVLEKAAPFFLRTSGRHRVHRTHELLRMWLRSRLTQLAQDIPTVGFPVRSEERGILFHGTMKVEKDNQQEPHISTSSSSPDSQDANGTFVDEVDAIIFATGYKVRLPFLAPEIRATVEGTSPQMLIDSPAPASEDPPAAAPPRDRGLFMGTVLASAPTMAFVGLQPELLPPFLLFEAQSKFVASAFTESISLPSSVEELRKKEAQLIAMLPELKDLYSTSGLGLHSGVYFDVLQDLLEVSSRDTYMNRIGQRRRWMLFSTILRFYHKMRSLAPLKRREQHLLFSNKI